jgi:hypothetical protein
MLLMITFNILLCTLPAAGNAHAADMTYVQTKDGSYPGTVSKGFAYGAELLWPAPTLILLPFCNLPTDL